MKKTILHLAIVGAVVFGGYLLIKGIQGARKRSLPEQKLMRTLETLTTMRKKQGYRGKQALVLSFAEGSRVVLLGNVRGNEESLKLIVHGLKTAGLLTEKGELAPHTYLILNGNMLGSTEANGAVLEMITHMLMSNPQKAWYLRGPEEDVDTLASRLSSLFGSKVSSSHLRKIQAFISTLPLGIYLYSQDLKEHPLRIAAYTSDSALFDRIACSPVDHQDPVKALCRLNDLCYYSEGDLAATIDGDDSGADWATTTGIERSDSSWHLISSPTVELTNRYGYESSAYVIIEMGKTLATSFLTLYYTPKGSQDFVQGARYEIGRIMSSQEEKTSTS